MYKIKKIIKQKIEKEQKKRKNSNKTYTIFGDSKPFWKGLNI